VLMTESQSAVSGSLNHCRLLLLIGILVNLVLFPLNHFVGMAVNHGDYTPFAVDPRVSDLVYDETQLYAPGPSRFFHSGKIQAELDVAELRDIPNGYPVLHSVLLGLLAKALGSMELAWMASHAVFPTLIWVLLYWYACRALRSAVFGAAIAWATCLFAFGPRNALLLREGSFIQPLELTRIAHPSISFLSLFLAIVLLAHAVSRPTVVRILLGGLAAGTLFYAYYFYWIAFFAGAGVLCLVLLWLKNWRFAKPVLAVLAIGGLAGVPYFSWTFRGMRSGLQQNLMWRVGTSSRSPDLPALALAGSLLIFFCIFCKFQVRAKSERNVLLQVSLLAAIVGAALGLNFHLLTGFDAQRLHFYNRALQPLTTYTAGLLILGYEPAKKKLHGRAMLTLTSIAMVLLISAAFLRQIQAGRNTAQLHRQSDPRIDALTWLRSHEPTGSVVGSTDRDLLTLIPGITGTWTFVPLGDRSMAPNLEILTRYLMLCRLENLSWPDVESELRSDEKFTSNIFYLSYVLVMHKMTPHELEAVRAIWDHLDLEREFRSRHLDYFITRSSQIATASSGVNWLTLIYQNSDWRVFKVNAH
jgi:hypothetical protein